MKTLIYPFWIRAQELAGWKRFALSLGSIPKSFLSSSRTAKSA